MNVMELIASRLRGQKGVIVHPSTRDQPDHISEIIERHEISVPVAAGNPIGERRRAYLWSVCRQLADEWAVSEGLELLDLTVFERYETHNGLEPAVGVWWTVVVGKSVASPAGSEPQWRWSARWLAWLHTFTAMRDGPDVGNVKRIRFGIPRRPKPPKGEGP